MAMANFTEDEIKVLIPIITFILGFIVSRFTMSKKERKDYESSLFATSIKLLEEQDKAFNEFSESLFSYANKKEAPNLNDFFSIATKGQLYFSKLSMSCDAIISGKLDKDSVKNTFTPKVKECVERSLPDFYDTLKRISIANKLEYNGELRKENYESLYVVYEKYCIQE
ncbi:hypothetical protein AYM39_08440 [Methylomonas sp. DH-1]|nr:hypothetical protein AYM39_08440 [Methylomonas sp. DH-1]